MVLKIKDINKEEIVASAWQVTDLFHWYNKKEIFSKVPLILGIYKNLT